MLHLGAGSPRRSVDGSTAGFRFSTVGVVLMVVGSIGLVISTIVFAMTRRLAGGHRMGTTSRPSMRKGVRPRCMKPTSSQTRRRASGPTPLCCARQSHRQFHSECPASSGVRHTPGHPRHPQADRRFPYAAFGGCERKSLTVRAVFNQWVA